jgi:hypothetical protein
MVIRMINPGPILGSVAQSFSNRIPQDVVGFLIQFVMIAQAVIEKIALPIHTMFSSDELLPILHRRFHSWFTRKRNDRVRMIWHKQAQPTMPDESLVVEFHGGEHGIASVCAAQLVFTSWNTVDRDERPTAVGYPLWNCVRQLRAEGQTHAGAERRRSRAYKRKKVGRAVFCTPSIPAVFRTVWSSSARRMEKTAYRLGFREFVVKRHCFFGWQDVSSDSPFL